MADENRTHENGSDENTPKGSGIFGKFRRSGSNAAQSAPSDEDKIAAERKKYGMAPARYLKGIRMDHAKTLLEERVPVQHVAQAVGYGDIYQFSRAYKQFFGHAPSQDGR